MAYIMNRTELLESLKASGLAEEAANTVIGNLDTYLEARKKSLDESYAKRLAQAKAVVLAETNRWKADQAKKLGFFLESKVANVEKQVRRQTGLNESQAIAELASLKQVLAGTPAENKALQAKIDQLTEEVGKLKTKETNLQEQYTKLYKVSQVAVKQNTKLERDLKESTQKLAESEKVIAESRNRTGGAKSPALTGNVINEENERKPKAPPAKPKAPTADKEVDAIAALID